MLEYAFCLNSVRLCVHDEETKYQKFGRVNNIVASKIMARQTFCRVGRVRRVIAQFHIYFIMIYIILVEKD